MPDGTVSLKEMTRLDKSNLSVAHGIRAAVVVVAPLVLAFAIDQPNLVYSTLGAMFITNTEGPNASRLAFPVLLLACLTEPIGFALGTLAGLTGLFAIPLVGLGVAIGLMAGSDQEFVLAGRFTAIFFAVGVGLPGGSVDGAAERLIFSLLGGLLAFGAAWAHRRLAKGSAHSGSSKAFPQLPKLSDFSLRTPWLLDAIVVGIASSFGLAVGVAIGLPRDFWIVVTVISAMKQRFGPTLNSAIMMVVGTILGAVIAASVTISVHNPYALEVLLLLFGSIMFATRGVNLGLTQVTFTPFIIILLNILYPGEWYLAEIRILDVGIGGAIAIATVWLLPLRARIVGARGGGKPSAITPSGVGPRASWRGSLGLEQHRRKPSSSTFPNASCPPA